MHYRTTIKQEISFEGVNMYNGQKNSITLVPNNGGGISFINKKTGSIFPLSLDSCTNSYFSIFMKQGKNDYVGTIEHMLGPLFDVGIDDVTISLSDGIVPTMKDGGVRQFYESLLEHKVQTDIRKKVYTLNNEISLHIPGKPDKIVASPGEGIVITYVAGFPHKGVQDQEFTYVVGGNNHYEISDARAVNLASAVPLWLRDVIGKIAYSHIFGYGHGATWDNILFMGEGNSGFINAPRYDCGTELVRHKITDFMGPIKMVKPLKNIHFKVIKSGHETDMLFAKLLNQNLVESDF